MNLARAQLVETYRPTYASISFSSGLPTNLPIPEPVPIAESSSSTSVRKRRDKKNPQVDQQKDCRAKLKSRKNGHFVVAGEKGYTIWNNSIRPVSPVADNNKTDIQESRDKGKKKEDLDDGPARTRPTEEAKPIKLCERDLGGSLDIALPLPFTPLLALVGGGREPVFPPNKVVVYHDKWPVPSAPVGSDQDGQGDRDGDGGGVENGWPGRKKGQVGRVIASIEYPEAVRAVKTRMNTLVVVLSESVIWYEYGMHPHPKSDRTPAQGDQMERDRFAAEDAGGTQETRKEGEQQGGFWLVKRKEWKTAYNPEGLAALSADVGSCLLAIPGRQPGHIQLVQLSPTSVTGTANSNTASAADSHPHAAFRSPIINAHSHTLSSLACSSDGKYLVSSSERGSIFRVWNVATGSLERELRRGVDKAVIWGVDLVYRPANAEKRLGRELWMVCWSDKGTVHVWGDVLGENKPTAAQTEAAKRNQSVTPKQALNSLLRPYIPVPKYFQAAKSSALFRLPLEETSARPQILGRTSSSGPSMRELALRDRYVVAWQVVRDARVGAGASDPPGYVPELQLVIVTHAGEWYRLAVPERKYVGLDAGEGTTSTSDRMGQEDEDADVRVDRCSVMDYVDLNVVDEW